MRMGVGTEERHREPITQIDESEQNGSEKINDTGQPEERRKYADGDQRATVENNLPSGGFAADVHMESGPRVILGENPGDREEVRHLPQKEDCKECQRDRIDFTSSCCPSHNRGGRTWKSADRK